MSDKLKGKVAIVTGASSGIGYAIAEALGEHGVKVGLLARRLDRLESLKEKLQSKEGEAVVVRCDVTNREQVLEAVEEVRKCFGPIDILINNAGVSPGMMTMMHNCRVDDWLQMVDVNITGTLYCYAAALPDMMDQKSGHIVNISSVVARNTPIGGAVYAGTKRFLQGHSAGMRQELSNLGVKVTVIQPGLTKTEILQPIKDEDVEEYLASKPEFARVFSEPMLESEDIAKAVIFALNQEDRVGVNEMMLEPKTSVFNRS